MRVVDRASYLTPFPSRHLLFTDASSIRFLGEEREEGAAFLESGGTGKEADMMSRARLEVGGLGGGRVRRSRSVTGVSSPAACTVRDRRDHRAQGSPGSMGRGFRSGKNESPRFKDPKRELRVHCETTMIHLF